MRLIHSDGLEYDKSVVDAQRLIGNVHLEYEGTQFFADSAYFFANDNFDAFGHIRMNKANEYTLTGQTMHFEENTHTASVRQDVVLKDGQMTLKTNFLDYNTRTGIATYQGGGHIVSSKDQNQLTSERGSYNSKSQTFYFRKKVELKNPDYKIYSDTLQYNELTEVAYFFGPTNIIGDSTRLYCENGYYNSRLDQSRFGKNAEVISGKMKLNGDSIYYDGKKGLGEVFRHVTISDTTARVYIHGQYGQHREATNFSYVTDRAWLFQDLSGGDSLFVRADSLFLKGDAEERNTMMAYPTVSFYHNDIQGACDSLLFFEKDSLLEMHQSPVLWHDNNQLYSDTLHLYLKNGGPDKLYLRSNAYILGKAISQSSVVSDSVLLHQIKGRKMTGQFIANELRSLLVEGNAQLIYFPESDKKEQPHIIGHNKGDCSNILVTINDRKIERIRLEQEPQSVYSPLAKVGHQDYFLSGSEWNDQKRPKSADDIRRFE